MRRAVLVAALLFFATTVSGAEKWWDAYNRGVAAVNGKSYAAADAALRAAIAENPTESTGVRAGKSIITYVPHFWLGIARFNLGDTDGALREWRISEEQGAVARTAYYSKLKDWEARAQSEKQRDAQKAASGPKKDAETAISRALEMQGTAMSAGGDRTPLYGDAQRKLQEALAQLRNAGTDSAALRVVVQTAQQASTLFSAAADEGKRLRAAAAARPKPVVPRPKPEPVIVVPMDAPDPVVKPPVPQEPVTVPAPMTSQAKAASEVAVQTYRRAITQVQQSAKGGPKVLRDFARAQTPRGEGLRDQLRGAKNDADYDRIRIAAETQLAEMKKTIAELNAPTSAEPKPVVAATAAAQVDVTPAYRAFATGDLAAAERLLTRIVDSNPAAEAFLLRGCVRYTRAMLSRQPDELLREANQDFREALQRNRSLRLDPKVFSPKLVARFEQVRRGR